MVMLVAKAYRVYSGKQCHNTCTANVHGQEPLQLLPKTGSNTVRVNAYKICGQSVTENKKWDRSKPARMQYRRCGGWWRTGISRYCSWVSWHCLTISWHCSTISRHTCMSKTMQRLASNKQTGEKTAMGQMTGMEPNHWQNRRRTSCKTCIVPRQKNRSQRNMSENTNARPPAEQP